MTRVLVACVGNSLRADDGLGPAVAERLDELPDGCELIETGIGGIALVQELLSGYDGLVIVDAVDRDAEPGAVFTIEPDIPEAAHVPDVHLANPQRVLEIAKALGVLPPRVVIVGCQPTTVDDLGERLSPAVAGAVPEVVRTVRAQVETWLAERATA